ncbi:MAG: VWA domain-containing protein [Gammaproteobacteria bacterium]|nr:VWA domain-containing protein [Gammaproteobacteria bacterium]
MIEAWQDFHFLRPWWLLGALPALALAALWARRRITGSHWRDAVEPRLLDALLERSQESRHRWTAWAAAWALLIGAAALAGPTWQRLPQPVERKEDGLVILFDLSLSMYAQDLSPSRLARAGHKIADVLRLRDEGFTALVAYAGDGHVVAPLTDDVRTIENLLTALSPAMMPVFGSNPASAIELALELFANARLPQGRLLLVTDGIDRVSEVAASCSRRFPLSILGVGTAAGAPIPLEFANQPGQQLRDGQGQVVRAALDSDRLATVADLCHGRYRSAGLGDADIRHLLATPLPGEDGSQAVEREFDAWADFGYWGAVLLLPVLLLGFRRGVLACVMAVLLPFPASASVWDDLWQRRDQQGWQALRNGSPEAAAELFEDADWRNAARYRSEDYPGAAQGWREAQTPTDHYNLGNALARLGEYQAAIAAYAQALTSAPNHEDAAFNKALVEQLLEQQAGQEAQSESPPNPGKNDGQPPQLGGQGADGPEQGEAGMDAAETDDPQGAGEPEDTNRGEAPPNAENADAGDAGDAEDGHDEQQAALEQWLRRVPDDPGGLLRRKFQYETNQRRRQGDYRNREREKIW